MTFAVRRVPMAVQLPLLVVKVAPKRPGPCPENPAGPHVRLDLSMLESTPTPPYCVWCGVTLP